MLAREVLCVGSMTATKADRKCSNPVEAMIEANMFGHGELDELFGAAPANDSKSLWAFVRGLDVPALRRVWSAALRELGLKTAHIQAGYCNISSGPNDPAGMVGELLWDVWCQRRIAMRSGRMELVRAYTANGSDRWVPVELLSYQESRAALERVFSSAGVPLAVP